MDFRCATQRTLTWAFQVRTGSRRLTSATLKKWPGANHPNDRKLEKNGIAIHSQFFFFEMNGNFSTQKVGHNWKSGTKVHSRILDHSRSRTGEIISKATELFGSQTNIST